jgi:phosphate transport system substrate-binding protein
MMYSQRILAGFLYVALLSSGAINAAECGPSGQTISIAGSTTVLQLAERWAEQYMVLCGDITVVVEGGGSSSGATRVCGGTSKDGGPVDIGDMSRDWLINEASPSSNGYLYRCIEGDRSRSAIQVPVALDGLSIAVDKNGTAASCLQKIGGLTPDQLRWIFTSYDSDQLRATGWDPESIPNSDGDESTHLWSELDARCSAVEIKLAGPNEGSGTFEYFHQTILVDLDAGETHPTDRPGGYFNSSDYKEVVAYIEAHDDAIAFFAYYLFLHDIDHLYAVPILNDEGDYVISSPESVADGTYNPLSRLIYMNLWNDAQSLENTRPFLQFGFSVNGTSLVNETGFVAIDESERELLLSSLPGEGKSFAVEVQDAEKDVYGSSAALSSDSQETSGGTPSRMVTMIFCRAAMILGLAILSYATMDFL